MSNFTGRHDGDGVRVPRGFDLGAFIDGARERSDAYRAHRNETSIQQVMALTGCSRDEADRVVAEAGADQAIAEARVARVQREARARHRNRKETP